MYIYSRPSQNSLNDPILTHPLHSLAINVLPTLTLFHVTMPEQCRNMDVVLNTPMNLKLRDTQKALHKLMAVFGLLKDLSNSDNVGSIIQTNENPVENCVENFVRSTFPATVEVSNGMGFSARIL